MSSVLNDPHAQAYLGELDTLDDMQPVPRKGFFFAELVTRGEIVLNEELDIRLAKEDPMTARLSMRPKRARVVMLGPAPDGEEWDFRPDDHVILPYHAGETYTWINQLKIEESIWVISFGEPLAVFRKRDTNQTIQQEGKDSGN